MTPSFRFVAAAAGGYLVGSLPSADIATRLATGGATQLRDVGSGNPGAANAIAVIGPAWGYGVLVADVGKGAFAARLGQRCAGANGAHLGGTAAVIGHCFPVWNGFHGGKGVAASAGQCLATFPVYMPVDLAVAGLTAISPWWKRRAFATTAVASSAWIAAATLWWRRRWPNAWGPPPSVGLPVAAAASSAVILYRFATATVVPAAVQADAAGQRLGAGAPA